MQLIFCFFYFCHHLLCTQMLLVQQSQSCGWIPGLAQPEELPRFPERPELSSLCCRTGTGSGLCCSWQLPSQPPAKSKGYSELGKSPRSTPTPPKAYTKSVKSDKSKSYQSWSRSHAVYLHSRKCQNAHASFFLLSESHADNQTFSNWIVIFSYLLQQANDHPDS